MANDTSMIIKYWGVRGSIPAPLTSEEVRKKLVALIRKLDTKAGQELFKERTGEGDGFPINEDSIDYFISKLPVAIGGTYGGDTTCIEVRARDAPLIVIDAGSGARHLGNNLVGRLLSNQPFNPMDCEVERWKDIHLFFSHYHWDHIQGFPFFAPAFIGGDKRANIHFYGKRNAKVRLSQVLALQQQYPNFPIEWAAMPCEKKYTELGRMSSTQIKLGNALVSYVELDHPDRVFGYAVEDGGKKFVCATDTEHRDCVDPQLVKLAKGADVLYYDAQYTPEEYSGQQGMPKVRWGHSTYEWAIKTALAAEAKCVVLGHHDPDHDDFKLDEIKERAINFKIETAGHFRTLQVIMAHQGLEQRI